MSLRLVAIVCWGYSVMAGWGLGCVLCVSGGNFLCVLVCVQPVASSRLMVACNLLVAGYGKYSFVGSVRFGCVVWEVF